MELTTELKNELKRLMWDYSLDDRTLWAIFEGKTSTFSLNQNKLYARLLLGTRWYKLLDYMGIAGLKEILNDQVINSIWIKDIREKFIKANNDELYSNPLQIGDKVRLRKNLNTFDKKSSAVFTKSVHTIESIDKNLYKVSAREHLYRREDLLKLNSINENDVENENSELGEPRTIPNNSQTNASTISRRLNLDSIDSSNIRRPSRRRRV